MKVKTKPKRIRRRAAKFKLPPKMVRLADVVKVLRHEADMHLRDRERALAEGFLASAVESDSAYCAVSCMAEVLEEEGTAGARSLR